MKGNKIILSFCFSIMVVCCLSIFPKNVLAAVLYLQPENKNAFLKEVFLEKVFVDTEGESINAIEAEIKYPKDILKVKTISTGNSILKLFVKEPKEENGKITFIGGVPGGYQGKNGLLILIAFEVINKKEAKIEIEETSRVILNDGKGTEAKTKKESAKINIFESEKKRDEWEEFIKKDKNPPEPFEIKLSRSPYIFDNKYFISFAAFDKESGIDYYEVAELLKKESQKELNWKKTKSPYLLEDQSLKSKIFVKAVDKAGNERIEVLDPKKNSQIFIILAIIIFIGFFGFIFVKLKRRQK